MKQRMALLPVWLAAACLLGLPCLAHAQDGSIPMHPPASTQVAPVSPHAVDTPLAWSELDATQQQMLAPMRGQWNRLPPARQHRLAVHAHKWARLPSAQRKMILGRLARWAKMSPEQRQQLRENALAYYHLSPAERERISQAFQEFQSLPPAQQRALRERWREMQPKQRMRWSGGHPPAIPMHPPAHSGH